MKATNNIVILKPWSEQESQSLYEIVKESMSSFLLWIPWCHLDFSFEDATRWSKYATTSYQRGRPIFSAYIGELMIGCIDVTITNDEGVVGYWVRQSLHGKGYGTQMLDRLIHLAFENYGLKRLTFMIGEKNAASRRLVEKFGATIYDKKDKHTNINGESMDMICYEIKP